MTVGEVAHAAAALLGVDNFALAVKAANLRYQELATGRHMLHLRDIFEVIIPGLISAGTITTVAGSKTVTGDATAQAAWTNDVVGRFLQVKNAFYEIANLQTDGTIILKTAYSETAVTAGGYKIIQRRVKLNNTVAQIGTMINMNLRLPIRTQDQDYLNTQSATRSAVSSGPLVASKIGEDADESPVYEFYPYSTSDTIVQYTGYKDVPDLKIDDRVPRTIPAHVLIEGIKSDLMQAEMSRALQEGKADEAIIWRNDYRAQQTVWNRAKDIAFRNDITTDDATFILQTTFGYGGMPTDFEAVRNAESHVWFGR